MLKENTSPSKTFPEGLGLVFVQKRGLSNVLKTLSDHILVLGSYLVDIWRDILLISKKYLNLHLHLPQYLYNMRICACWDSVVKPIRTVYVLKLMHVSFVI